jgi:integrative and conjugative element protein (TIGR02256 family)
VSARLAWWRRSALTAALAEAGRAFPQETGGVLLGWAGPAGDVVVDQVLGPGPGAIHAARSFHPDAAWQQEQIVAAYQASGRRLEYLGDWHTHPSGLATPSSRDLATLRHIARHAEVRAPRPVMAIFAGGTKWRLGIQRLNGPRAWRAKRLQLRVFD